MQLSRVLHPAAAAGLAGAIVAGSLTLVPSLAAAAVTPATTQRATTAIAAVAQAEAAALPQADVLDVGLRDGTPVDHAQTLAPTILGEPALGADAVRARSTISFDGVEDAVKFPFGAEHAKLASGFSVECTFRFDGPTAPTSEKALCSAKEGGGFATVANSAGLTFMAHIGGGYKSASVPLVPGRWYHTVAVWDGTEVRLFVDGVLAKSVAATGAYKAPTGGASSLVLGGDSQPGDGVGFWSQSTLQNARIYTQPLDQVQVTALAESATQVPAAPEADVFDVDFSDGTAADTAGGLQPTVWNTPEIVDYAPLGRKVGRFDGSSAFYYPFSTKYEEIRDAMSVECVFKYDADYPASGEERGNLCAGKEAGGFAITLYGSEISFNPHIGGAYRNTKIRLEESDRWYHVVGTYDGSAVRLYVNGRLAATTPASGSLSNPSPAGAELFVIGGDASNGKPSFFAPAHIASARIFSRAVDLEEVLALQAAAFGARDTDDLVTLRSSAPAEGERITRATRLRLEFDNAEAIAKDVAYALDGDPVTPGTMVGTGLASGRHTLTVDGRDHFGNVIAERVEFTSANIPDGGGTETGQANGEVRLSARATNPGGGDVTTTFLRGEVVMATEGVQGTLAEVPTELDFDGEGQAPITDRLLPGDDVLAASPSADVVSYQRFDVPVSAAADGQQVTWTGTIDPTRKVALRLWDGTRWEVVAQARGSATGQVTLTGAVAPAHVAGDRVPVLVTAEDPFADDLAKPVADGFEDPVDHDFSIAHLTDTQYLSEGAVEQETPEERAVWKKAYTDVTQWVADNASSRKIMFAAHTGDIIENLHSSTDFSPEYEAVARAEFEVASDAQRILDEAGVVNSVLPGNHDNRYGTDTGVQAMYNDYFGPDRYTALQSGERWQTQSASYHPWKPGDNSNSINLFTASGLDFVVVNLGFGVDDEEIAWANQVLEQYQDRNAIVQTHAHTTPSTNPDGRGAGLSYDGNKVRNQVAAQNPNVFLVLSGHEHGVNIEVVRDLGRKGNNVVELLADYQFYRVSAGELGLTEIGGYDPGDQLQFGSSFFRMLQFDVDRAEMSVDTYSPLLDDFGATEYDDRLRYNGHEDDFTLPVQLETRTTSFATDAVTVVQPTEDVIGTATARSGWPAEVTWSGLKVGETYAWYARSADAASGAELPGEVTQLAVFTADSGGTDTAAPAITVPATTQVEHGSTFDPMAGVEATDDTDGDLTADVTVTGAVDPGRIGTYSLVYTVADANGNQAVATRTVEVTAPPAPVNTGLPTISGRAAVGSLLQASMGTWQHTEKATMDVQWFRDGVAVPGATGTEHTVTAADRGSRLTVQVRAKAVGHDPVVVRSAPYDVAEQAQAKAEAAVSLRLDRKTVRSERAAVLTIRVRSDEAVTGEVEVKVDGRTYRTVTLRASDRGVVEVKLRKLKVGKHTVRAVYLGSDTVERDRSAKVGLRVRR